MTTSQPPSDSAWIYVQDRKKTTEWWNSLGVECSGIKQTKALWHIALFTGCNIKTLYMLGVLQSWNYDSWNRILQALYIRKHRNNVSAL